MLFSTGAFFGSVVGAPITYGTLNPSDKNANITLSNGDLTATKAAGGTGWVSVRSQTSHSSGKYYYEWTPNEFSGSFLVAGIANSSAALTTFIGADANGVSLVTDGKHYKEGAAVSGGRVIVEGDVCGIAIDLDLNKFWSRIGAGAWDGQFGGGGQDPATGTGGVDLPSGITSGGVFAAVSVQLSPTDASTVNFGATAFTHTPPSGFADWG